MHCGCKRFRSNAKINILQQENINNVKKNEGSTFFLLFGAEIEKRFIPLQHITDLKGSGIA